MENSMNLSAPVLNVQELQEKANAAAQKAALSVIDSFYND